MHSDRRRASWLKERVGLFALITVFVLLKLPHLQVPFYWDESWSYAPGLQLMYRHGPSLMPDAIDTFYSRGHPLLFYAAMAGWMRIFGPSHLSMHCFSLTVSVLLLMAVFEVSRRLFNLRVAYSAVIFLAVQVAFFVQASMCLPEIMIALLVLLSLYLFTTRHYLLLCLALTAMLFTKESGAAMGLVAGLAVLAELFAAKKTPLRERLLKLAAVALAALSIGAFFILQKRLNGWYFFPEHTGLINLDYGTFWGKFKYGLDFLLSEDRRYWVLRGLGLAAAAGLFWKDKRLLAGALLLCIAVFGALLNDKLLFVNDKLMLGIVTGLLGLLLGAVMLDGGYGSLPRGTRTFVVLCFALFMVYLLFCSINFFTGRYLLYLFPVLAILLSWFFDRLLPQGRLHALRLMVPVCYILIAMRAFCKDSSWGDTHLRAFAAMDVQQRLVRFLEDRNCYDRHISGQSFQTRQHLTSPLTGMLRTPRSFSSVRWDIDNTTDIVVFDDIEPDSRYDQVKSDPDFKRIYRLQNGEVWAEVYERKKP